jgi:hypothetical protein
VPWERPALAARYRVGHGGVDEAGAEAVAGADPEAAGDDAEDDAAVALDETADEAVDEAVGEAAVEAAGDDEAVVGLTGAEADVDVPAVHPATPSPRTTATTPTAARPADLVAPNIAALFPRPGAAAKRDTESHHLYAF